MLRWVCLFVALTIGTQSISQAEPLPGTKPLTITEPLDEVMVDGINRYALRAIKQSRQLRDQTWRLNGATADEFQKRMAERRQQLSVVIGAVDERTSGRGIEKIDRLDLANSRIGEFDKYDIYPVRWSVLDGVTAEGLLLQPHQNKAKARVVCLPDADWTPEQFVGLTPGLKDSSLIPHLLAQQGIQVLVPTLISRDQKYSGHPDVRYTNIPHREFIYRMAYEMGRHVIGYEVQKVLAAVDELERLNKVENRSLPIGVTGVGEGGLLALYSAAIDERISSTLVSGYFQKREDVWQEPMYRNVWSLLTQFGDAELAAMVAPRSLLIEACRVPEVDGPPKPMPGRSAGAAPGQIKTATLDSVRDEFERFQSHAERLNQSTKNAVLFQGENGTSPAGSLVALDRFCQQLGIEATQWETNAPKLTQENFAAVDRQKRQFDELVEFTQKLMRESARKRDKFWAKANRKSVETWAESTQFYRDHIMQEFFGQLPTPTIDPNVHTRSILETNAYTGYEVTIDVYPDVIASGILLLPKGMTADEKRPVVVCQHGLEGIAMDTITDSGRPFQYYKAFAATLAERGFIVYSPQNPYRGEDRFRSIQRKSNPMKRSLFSYIIPQHERTLDWLETLPNVDAGRIAFYGLSYGGKTAVRVPPMVERYALSICSADFDEWILKNVTNKEKYSYVFTGEYEMFDWNMGHVANYAELSSLMTPRPFMVERGHNDGVAPDEWVAWEYAKVRRHYVQLGLGDKTTIEYFNGPHQINAVGTFAFLHKHLNWPMPDKKSE